MTKSFLFLALVLSLVLAQTCSAKPLSKADSDDDDESDYEDDSASDSEDEDEENPAPSCMLFGDNGCHVECTITAQAYGVKAEGHCNEYQTCQCQISGDVSFHERWEKVFDADYVYRKITENQTLEDQARRIFSFPLRSAKEFKQLFKPFISPYQFSKLAINDDSMAAKFAEKGEDKIDKEAVRKYVSEKIAKLVKSPHNKSLLTTKYKQNFKKFLNEFGEEKGTLFNLTFRVHQLKNNALDEIFDEYLKKNKLEEPIVDEVGDEGLAVTLINAITNEIMELNDDKNNASNAKKKATLAKKPSTKKDNAKPKFTEKSKPAAKPKPAEKADADAKKA